MTFGNVFPFLDALNGVFLRFEGRRRGRRGVQPSPGRCGGLSKCQSSSREIPLFRARPRLVRKRAILARRANVVLTAVRRFCFRFARRAGLVRGRGRRDVPVPGGDGVSFCHPSFARGRGPFRRMTVGKGRSRLRFQATFPGPCGRRARDLRR